MCWNTSSRSASPLNIRFTDLSTDFDYHWFFFVGFYPSSYIFNSHYVGRIYIRNIPNNDAQVEQLPWQRRVMMLAVWTRQIRCKR